MIKIELLHIDENSKIEDSIENEENIGIEKLCMNENLKIENIIDFEKNMLMDE